MRISSQFSGNHLTMHRINFPYYMEINPRVQAQLSKVLKPKASVNLQEVKEDNIYGYYLVITKTNKALHYCQQITPQACVSFI